MTDCRTTQAQSKNRPQTNRARRKPVASDEKVRVMEVSGNGAVGPPPSLDPGDANVSRMADDAKGVKQPNDDADHHHDVEDVLNFAVHRDVGVDQPEQHADDDEGDDEGD